MRNPLCLRVLRFAVESGTFTRLVRLNLFHRRNIDNLMKPPEPLIADPRQMVLELRQC